MDCPNDWTDCKLCAYWDDRDKICAYVPEEELSESELAKDLGINIPSIRETWFERFSRMNEDERWEEYYKHHSDDLISKEPYKAMAGAVEHGGGSKSGKKHKKPKKDLPEYLKSFGQ
ncbi:hypothetical protein DEAC_c17190 [Desulfosporosinus acididurans]|uniref:Uncharacterized protein n=1 Tax=Desulfosporosinus acididurans TaxID=476652 RepID=A0A0J1FS47_9FIRM|nr:hypothetical protein [Desulfosporosinus acididurans]KLU66320.1 hypothetical protein DEAC_c17190 [Desulfosporosinus acididurans]